MLDFGQMTTNMGMELSLIHMGPWFVKVFGYWAIITFQTVPLFQTDPPTLEMVAVNMILEINLSNKNIYSNY